MPLYKNELRNKALQLRKALKNENIEISFGEDSFRDYALSVLLSGKGGACGKLSIYYKPSKNTYSIKKQTNNDETAKKIDAVWDALNGSPVYDAGSGIYEAFVDGSYICGKTGYGAVIYLGAQCIAELSGIVNDTEFRQFGGELRSVIEVLKWCAANKAAKVRINYDYQGIEKFITGEWKPKNDFSKEYVDFVRKAKTEIIWRHIRSHSGNVKNDEADALAKKAALSAGTVRGINIKLEKKVSAFVDFLNKSPGFSARYAGALNGETAKIEVENKHKKEIAAIEIKPAKAGGFSLKQTENSMEQNIHNLWQEFLFAEDFKN